MQGRYLDVVVLTATLLLTTVPVGCTQGAQTKRGVCLSLLVWWRSRAWRRAANEAISPVHLPGERVRLWLEIVERVTQAEREASGEEAQEKRRAKIEAVVSRVLNDKAVQTSLALRYVQGLQDRVGFGDYEDARALQAEAVWVRSYFSTRLRSSLVASFGGVASNRETGPTEQLSAILAAKIVNELQAASLAA